MFPSLVPVVLSPAGWKSVRPPFSLFQLGLSLEIKIILTCTEAVLDEGPAVGRSGETQAQRWTCLEAHEAQASTPLTHTNLSTAQGGRHVHVFAKFLGDALAAIIKTTSVSFHFNLPSIKSFLSLVLT